MLLLATVLAFALSGAARAENTATSVDLPLIAPTDTQARSAPADPLAQNAPADQQDQKGEAKEPPTPPHTGVRALFGNLVEDVKHLPEMQNVYIAGTGGALALAVHPVDQTFNQRLMSTSDAVNAFFAPGKYLGDTSVQVAFSVGAYAVGRLRDQPKVAHLGMDLVQAQLMSELLVEPLKFATQRERPDGSDHRSFPSGHASVTFATATVIERHLGWRKSVLGYAIATYVAMSRMHDNRHYLSDVVFGAAVGTIAGRTVVHHQADYWAFTPMAVPGGGVALMVTRTRWNP